MIRPVPAVPGFNCPSEKILTHIDLKSDIANADFFSLQNFAINTISLIYIHLRRLKHG